MSLVEFAEAELRRAGLFDEDADYDGLIAHSVIGLMELFAAQGHSGGSAMQILELFNRLARFKPLGPLTGSEDEWNDVSGYLPDGKQVFQNRRRSTVFKDAPDGVAHDIEAVVLVDPSGLGWNPPVWESIEFPYVPPEKPKIVYIDQHGRALDPDESRYNKEGFCDDDGCLCWYGGPMINIPERT